MYRNKNLQKGFIKKKFIKRSNFDSDNDLNSEIESNVSISNNLIQIQNTDNKKKKVKRKPNQEISVNYFNDNTQKAIIAYQNTKNVNEKNKIYVNEIMPAFDSLIKNLINVYGFNVMYENKQDLKNECLEFLYTAIDKFNPNKGTKAFSYFNVIAKNWLTIKSKQNARKLQTYISLDNKEDISKEDLETIENFQVMPSWEEILAQDNSLNYLKRIIENIESKIKTENEILCLNAIKILLDNIEDLDLLNKRAILLYIREMTNLNSKQLSLVLSSFKKYYKEIKHLIDD